MENKIGQKVWFKTADGARHRGTIDSILPQLGGGEIYLIKGPKDIGLLTISEQNIINSNS